MDNEQRICHACMLPKAPKDFAAVERSIVEYGLVADEDKASHELYLARLEKCLSCSRLVDITCMKCKSYVQVCAMDKNKSCPHPEKKPVVIRVCML